MYENSEEEFYFDYVGVVDLLEKTKEKVETSLRCLRPGNIPDDIAWCEMTNTDYEFDPFVYDGSMSIDDFEKAQAAVLNDIAKTIE